MEDQQHYRGFLPDRKEWRLKQLQPLSGNFEKQLAADLQLICDDTKFAPLHVEEMGRIFRTVPMVDHARSIGYFFTTIHGPGHYCAYGICKTPYTMPLVLVEYNPDKLQSETADWVDMEADVQPEKGGEG